MSLPDVEVLTPTFLTDLVALPFQADILLDPQTQTRWKKDGETFVRDYEGEASWEEMALLSFFHILSSILPSYHRQLMIYLPANSTAS